MNGFYDSESFIYKLTLSDLKSYIPNGRTRRNFYSTFVKCIIQHDNTLDMLTLEILRRLQRALEGRRLLNLKDSMFFYNFECIHGCLTFMSLLMNDYIYEQENVFRLKTWYDLHGLEFFPEFQQLFTQSMTRDIEDNTLILITGGNVSEKCFDYYRRVMSRIEDSVSFLFVRSGYLVHALQCEWGQNILFLQRRIQSCDYKSIFGDFDILTLRRNITLAENFNFDIYFEGVPDIDFLLEMKIIKETDDPLCFILYDDVVALIAKTNFLVWTLGSMFLALDSVYLLVSANNGHKSRDYTYKSVDGSTCVFHLEDLMFYGYEEDFVRAVITPHSRL